MIASPYVWTRMFLSSRPAFSSLVDQPCNLVRKSLDEKGRDELPSRNHFLSFQTSLLNFPPIPARGKFKITSKVMNQITKPHPGPRPRHTDTYLHSGAFIVVRETFMLVHVAFYRPQSYIWLEPTVSLWLLPWKRGKLCRSHRLENPTPFIRGCGRQFNINTDGIQEPTYQHNVHKSGEIH